MSNLKKQTILVFGVLTALFVFYYRVRLFIVVKPFLWGVVFAALLAPFAHRLEKKMPAGLAVGVIYTLLLIGVGALLFFGVPALLRAFFQSVAEVPRLWEELKAEVSLIRALPDVTQAAEKRLPEMLNKLGAWDAVGATGKELGKLLVGLVLSAYFLKDRKMLSEEFFSLFPEKWNGEAEKISREMAGVFGVYLRGRLLLSVAVGLLSWPAFFFCRVPHAGVFAFLFGLLDILPFFGPVIAALPAVLLSLSRSIPLGIILSAVLFVIEEAESLVLQPKLIGGALRIHPAAAILAVMMGTVSFGFFGAILSIPLFAAGKILVKRIFYHVV